MIRRRDGSLLGQDVNNLARASHVKIFPRVFSNGFRVRAQAVNLLLKIRVLFLQELDLALKLEGFLALVPQREQAVRAENTLDNQRNQQKHNAQQNGSSHIFTLPIEPAHPQTSARPQPPPADIELNSAGL